MKKFIVISLSALLGGTAFFLPSRSLQAQRMKNWTWKSQNLRFQLPANWKIKRNTATVFIAKGPNNVTIKIAPAHQRTAIRAARYGLNTYRVILRKRIIQKKYISSGGTGLMRYITFGTGQENKYRRPVNFGIIGLKNKKTRKTHYVRFWWYIKDNARFNRITYKIATSFRAYR